MYPRNSRLGMSQLKKMGVVLKKAQYFITCHELAIKTINEVKPENVRACLIPKSKKKKDDRQLKLE
ncbi:hypothetical protein EZS27_009196 [termite gut metagenome]|uniref:Uncharacterized protein n=1 Tax=termite gut metagenome TaxID=433724 RepID=A0A5J4SCQ6_9ZZZZ